MKKEVLVLYRVNYFVDSIEKDLIGVFSSNDECKKGMVAYHATNEQIFQALNSRISAPDSLGYSFEVERTHIDQIIVM